MKTSQQSRTLLLSQKMPRKYERFTKIGLCLLALFYICRIEKINNEIKALHMRSTFNWIAGTNNGDEFESQWHSEFPEKIVPMYKRKSDDKIRFAAFGSSQTFGAGLGNRDTETYIKKLSLKHGSNYGIRSSGPNYPAACTKSILGNDEFDVLILEFFTVADKGMKELAQRLRERFPEAIIVIARLWDPPMLENIHGQGLRNWARERGYGDEFIHDSNFKAEFLSEYAKNEWHWIFQTNHKEFVDIHDEIARETGSYIVPMAWDHHAAGDEGYLAIGDKMLGPDSFHLSAEGHEDFANRVRALVERVGVPKNPRIGEFLTSDYCLNWFQTGAIGEGLKLSENAVVGKMPNTEKYALTFEGQNKTGWIEMTNPSNEMMYIFIAFMTTAPPPSKYPKTEAAREDGEDNSKVMLDPVAHRGNANMKVHVSDMVYLGKVLPNQTAKVSFTPKEETEWPFRIVQAVLTGKEDFGSSFASMPDP